MATEPKPGLSGLVFCSLLLVGCLPAGVRQTPAGPEYLVTGRLLVSRTFCGTPPTPASPSPGEVRVFRDGRNGFGGEGEAILIVPAGETGAFELFLPPGKYCLSGAGLCERELVVGGPVQQLDVRHTVGPPKPCEHP